VDFHHQMLFASANALAEDTQKSAQKHVLLQASEDIPYVGTEFGRGLPPRMSGSVVTLFFAM
jgi:hypothetical protein